MCEYNQLLLRESIVEWWGLERLLFFLNLLLNLLPRLFQTLLLGLLFAGLELVWYTRCRWLISSTAGLGEDLRNSFIFILLLKFIFLLFFTLRPAHVRMKNFIIFLKLLFYQYDVDFFLFSISSLFDWQSFMIIV